MVKSKGTVLLVDDNPALLKLLAKYMKDNGYEVLTSLDGLSAIEQAVAHKPHTIVLDIMMPGVDGVLVLKQLKSSQITKGIPVIMLTGISDKEKVLETIKEGAAEYVVKGATNTIELCKRIAAWVEKRKEEVEKEAEMASLEADSENQEHESGLAKRERAIAEWDLRDIIKKMSARKTCPKAIAKIISTALNPDATIREWDKIIEKYRGIANLIHKLTTTSLIGKPFECEKAEDAVAKIGVSRLRSLAISLAFLFTYGLRMSDDIEEQYLEWRHALKVGVIARSLALACSPGNVDTAFAAGMLHDVGKSIFREQIAEEFKVVRKDWEATRDPSVTIEKAIIGVDHAEYSGHILKGWEMPPELVEPIALHHTSWKDAKKLATQNPDLVALIKLANTLAKVWGKTAIYGDGAEEIPDSLTRYLGLEADMLDSLKETSLRDLETLEDALLGSLKENVPNSTANEFRRNDLENQTVVVIDGAPPVVDPLSLFFKEAGVEVTVAPPQTRYDNLAFQACIIIMIRSLADQDRAREAIESIRPDGSTTPLAVIATGKSIAERLKQEHIAGTRTFTCPYSLKGLVSYLFPETTDAESETMEEPANIAE